MQPAGRPVPHRGARAAAADPAGVRRRRARRRLRPHLGGLVPAPSRRRSTSCAGTGRADPRRARASPRWARGRACCASAATSSPSTPTAGSGRATARGASARWAKPSRPAAPPPSREVPGILVDLRAAALRRLRRRRDRPGGGGRLPRPQRRHARSGPTARRRAAGLARVRHPLPPGHPAPRARHHPAADQGRQAARRSRSTRSEFVALHVGAGLRRRPGMGATGSGRAGTGRGERVDLARPRHRGPRPFGVIDHVGPCHLRRGRGVGDVRARHASAATTRAASPTWSRSRPESRVRPGPLARSPPPPARPAPARSACGRSPRTADRRRRPPREIAALLHPP